MNKDQSEAEELSLSEDQILDILEKQGDEYQSGKKTIYQPRDIICQTIKNKTFYAKNDQILTFLHDIKAIESPKVITGLLLNLPAYVSSGTAEQVWIDLINACQVSSCFLDMYGIMETLRLLIVLDGSANGNFLDFLVNSNIPLDIARPYAIETLYDYLPVDFFNADEDRKMFLANLFVNAFSEGDIHHRSFLIQLLFAIHPDIEQVSSVSDLQEEFWKVIFDISLEPENFSDLLAPARKLKIIIDPFFEEENPIISQALSDFDLKIENSEDYIPFMLNLFKIFYLFPTNDMINFLQLCINAFSKFNVTEWNDIKSISHLIYESLNESRFLQPQVDEIYNFAASLPESAGRYFIFVHFIEIFGEFCDYVDIFIKSMCDDWLGSETFDPVIFCFCISQVTNSLRKNDEIFETVIYPEIFSYIEAKDNPLLNYEALKAFNHFYRDDLIQVPNFLNSLLDLISNADPPSLKHLFKIVSDVELHTRPHSSDDDDDEIHEEEEEAKDESDAEEESDGEKDKEQERAKLNPMKVNKEIRNKLEDFIRSNLMNDEIDPCLCGYLCDIFPNFMNDDETDKFIDQCFEVCKRLTTDPIPIENPDVLSQVSSLILAIFRYSKDENVEKYFTQFYPLYETLLNLVVNFDFTLKEGENDSKTQKAIANTAFLLSFIFKTTVKRNCQVFYDFPMIIIIKLLNSEIDDLVKFGLSIARRAIPIIYPYLYSIQEQTEEEQNTQEHSQEEQEKIEQDKKLLTEIFVKIIDVIGTTEKVFVVDSAFKLFDKIIRKFPEIERIDPIAPFIDQAKSLVFDGRMKIFRCQSITKIETDYHHFHFFFLTMDLVDNNYQLSPIEIFTLIRWVEYISQNYLQDLIETISIIIESDQLSKTTFLLKPLWKTLNSKLNDLSYSFSDNRDTIISILNATVKFLEFTTSKNLGKCSCTVLFHCLQYFWGPYESFKQEHIDVVKIVGPIYLRVYALNNQISDMNCNILNQIGESMIKHEYSDKDWNYAQMVEDIILIYEKFQSLLQFDYVGANVLFYYFFRGKDVFPEELTNKIRETLNDMTGHDSRITEYLFSKHKKEYIDLVLDDYS